MISNLNNKLNDYTFADQFSGLKGFRIALENFGVK